MSKLSRDLAIPVGGVATLNPREVLFAAGVISGVGGEVIIACDGSNAVALDLRGTFNGTIEVAGSVDGINFVPIPMRQINAASVSYVAAVAGSGQGAWVGKCAGFRIVRARCTAFTSGSFNATLAASTALLDDTLQGQVTPQLTTTLGTAGAATTLTLASPGVGLRHYLTYLSINRFATALLTAGSAPVNVTTTNLPGSLAFSFPADAAAQGSIDRWREDFSYPLAASAQNTATTIVAPATTGVIWRMTAGFYVAP